MKEKKGAGRREKTKKKSSSRSTAILVGILLLGLCILAYPTVSDWWNSFHQSRAIASYASIVENTSEEDMEVLLEAARAYNAALLNKESRFVLSEEELEEYRLLLDLSGTGVMGYVQIPAINVNLPIYHGTEESVLQIAVGHIEGTSLPVGGESTHAALSGHRGLPRARLFTDLDKMKEGDIFTVTVLNQTVTYEVDQIRIVEPADVAELDILPGEDHCTLITCTPYGINTHRMLVRGRRVANIAEDKVIVVNEEAGRIPNYIVIPAVAVPLLFLFLLGMLLYYRRRPRAVTEEDMPDLLLDGGQPEERHKKKKRK